MIRNLSEASREEQLEFINSFDHVLTDIDGVVWLAFAPIPDAQQCLDNFRKLGKSVNFITNYSFQPRSTTLARLKKNKFTVELDEIHTPMEAVIHYLKSNNFQKKIFAIASSFYKNELVKEGFQLAEDPPCVLEESFASILQHIQDDKEIGAVIFDYDVLLTFIKLQKVLTLLKRADCIFITGGADKQLPVGPMGPLLGNYHHYQSLIEISGRQPLHLAKPSIDFCKYVVDKTGITNPERVLFLGDTINEDMQFAANAGFKNMLVLSGTTKIEDITNWKHPEEQRPNYYIENLTELNKIIKMVHKL